MKIIQVIKIQMFSYQSAIIRYKCEDGTEENLYLTHQYADELFFLDNNFSSLIEYDYPFLRYFK